MVNPNRFYTYAYLREDKTPYYIGKGKEDRIYSKQKNIKPPKDKSRVIYLKQNLTEEEAFKHEIYMIDVFGRKDLGTGILHNRTGGGDGTSGRITSEETRKRISEANKNPSEETRKKMSEANKNPSEETRRKLSESRKKRIISEETRKKKGEAHKNRIFSEEQIKKLSEANKGNTNSLGKTRSDETKRKIGDANKGRKWWNDGCGNYKRMIECPGNGWKPGMK